MIETLTDSQFYMWLRKTSTGEAKAQNLNALLKNFKERFRRVS